MIESEPGHALVRAVPDRYAEATVAFFGAGTIDVARARREHRQYLEGLRALGLQIVVVPRADALPDSCFVEDTAVVAGQVALIARSAHPGRRPEADAVAEVLKGRGLRIHRMQAPACLDGGDVLRVGSTLFVSRTTRTNAAGVQALREAFGGLEVREVPLPEGVLHLKCVCSSPAPGLVVVTQGTVEASFEGLRTVLVPPTESYAANTVGARGRVLVSEGHPRTAEALARAGLEVVPRPTGEFRKGDGSLTCLSILLP